ncbi:MAG: uroporphyrinogen-III synthase [Pyrinomonadaceae bacterium]|nr:uroporphyrinogen-III synthase [Pyrinomonadaceae bacterium]
MQNFSAEKTYALFANPFNKKTISDLAEKNVETVIFPGIMTEEIEFEATIIESLSNFDWLVFTDVYTVEYFVNALEKKGIELFELDALRVLAFGESVADRLRFSQLHADVIPSTVKTSDVLQSLQDYIFEDFSELKFLILKEEKSQPEIAEELKRLNSTVTELGIYFAKVEDENEIPKLKALLKGGAIDEFIFSTHFDVLNLAQMFQAENLKDILDDVTLTAIDNLTLQSLKEFRLT